MLPQFPHTKVNKLDAWSNYSKTIENMPIDVRCAPALGPDDGHRLERHGKALCAIVKHCFEQTPPATLRTVGSTWSFSKVIEPGQVMLDMGNLSVLMRVPEAHFSATYSARAKQGFAPFFAEGGLGIAKLNQQLGAARLALQTSGSGNGHRIAGCIATGTHGSALKIGALHDTVLALYLIVGPNEAVFVQANTGAPFLPSAATWLEDQTKVPTRFVQDDDALAAALVSLGSIGVVMGVIVEATSLYQFKIVRRAFNADDPIVVDAIHSLNTEKIDPRKSPDYFSVIMHPYPDAKASWFVNLMWKEPIPGNVHFTTPLQGIPRTSSDTMGMIAVLAHHGTKIPLANLLTFAIIKAQIYGQLEGDARPAKRNLFPGEVFGPTTLPPGKGASTEIAVDHKDLRQTMKTIQDVLHAEALGGKLLLGCVALRFVPKTRAFLGMNQADMTCFIELPSIRNSDVLHIYKEIWEALDKKGVKFTTHWGQLNAFTPQGVDKYFGANVAHWKKARRSLLGGSDIAMKVFASSILKDAGLDG